jgi:hypothetical protein
MHKVICAASRNSWKARPKTVIARYAKQRKPYFLEGFSRVNIRALARILLYSSKSGHEKPWLKLGRPRPKAKYILQSIVNQYREGKAKIMCVQGVGAQYWAFDTSCSIVAGWFCLAKLIESLVLGDGVLFVERSNELLIYASLRFLPKA